MCTALVAVRERALPQEQSLVLVLLEHKLYQ